MSRSSFHRSAAAALAFASLTLAACGVFDTGASSPDIVLNVASFEPVECEEATQCFELKASTDGQGTGQGSCSVIAIDDQRQELWIEKQYDDLSLETDAEFQWIVPVQEPNDDRFAEWKVECEPQGEG